MQSFFHSVREYITPVLKESKFAETGHLTPEEFVAAGDFLTFKCPTWQWHQTSSQQTEKSEWMHREWLPTEKQFLITKGGKLN